MAGGAPIHIVSVSMPRSGHHMLVAIFTELLGDKFKYCEYYLQSPCCKSIPCKRVGTYGGASVFMQKSHDMEFDDVSDTPGCHQLIQYRQPIPRLLSDYNAWFHTGGCNSGYNFKDFMADRAVYSIRFHRKWFSKSSNSRFFLQYERLCADPARAVDDFLRFINISIAIGRIEEAVSRCIEFNGNDLYGGIKIPFNLSSIESHEKFDRYWFGLLEKFVIFGCEGYRPTRQYATGELSPLQSLLFRDVSNAAKSEDWDEVRGLANALLVEGVR